MQRINIKYTLLGDHAKAEILRVKYTGYHVTYSIVSYSYKYVCHEEYIFMHNTKSPTVA